MSVPTMPSGYKPRVSFPLPAANLLEHTRGGLQCARDWALCYKYQRTVNSSLHNPFSSSVSGQLSYTLMKMDNKSTSLHSNGEDTAVMRPSGAGTEHGSSASISPEDPPFMHGFLDRDPESSKARSLYFKIIGGSLFLVFTYVIWGVLPIYWASVFKLYDHAHNLHGWVVVSIRSVCAPCFQSQPVVTFRISMVGPSARR
jgi:hypothetical protein